MNNWLLFLLKSTIIISLLYLVFRMLMSNETFFKLSRITLLTIVFVSIVIPLIHLPASEHTVVDFKVSPAFLEDNISQIPDQNNLVSIAGTEDSSSHTVILPVRSIIIIVYIAGVIISLLYFIYSILSVVFLFKNARSQRVNGVDLMVTRSDIPAFSFRRNILISEKDLEHADSIVTHELSHIRLGHFYDLMLMELLKIIYWFNPLIYRMNRDLKDIHEFQADDNTLESGLDAARYQLLIIQKCVGQKSFALANSFNHCQIKKRITMMNKSKTSKAWWWKVATFLPVLALFLMAFSNRDEIVVPAPNLPADVIAPTTPVQNNYAQFKRKIEIKNSGNYIDNKQVSLDEIAKKGEEWYKTGNDWIFLLVDESIPLSRIDEVRGALKHSYWIVQTTINSNDLVYFAGDVSDGSKFSQGKYNDWLANQLKNYPEIKSNGTVSFETIPAKDNNPEMKVKVRKLSIAYSFIIGRDGKVRDAHVVQSSGYPDVDAAFDKILSQMPDWIPAKRGKEVVSVYNYFSGGATTLVEELN